MYSKSVFRLLWTRLRVGREAGGIGVPLVPSVLLTARIGCTVRGAWSGAGLSGVVASTGRAVAGCGVIDPYSSFNAATPSGAAWRIRHGLAKRTLAGGLQDGPT